MSTTLSIDSLYASRCKLDEGRLVPSFWGPRPLVNTPMCRYSDVRNLSSPEMVSVVKRLITLALGLEVEVGGYILKGTARELPNADAALMPLLKSNAADESRHFKGFQYAAALYGQEGDASELVSEWGKAADKYHPIAIAGILEAGLFLVSLGILRVFGGPSMTNLAIAVAEDEFRHVCTNYAVAEALGAWNPNEVQDLMDHSLEWVWGGCKGDRVWNLTNVRKWSAQLLHEQEAPQFDSLTWYTTHTPPFEVGNEHIVYTRESGEA